ncbi:MAG: glycosyltransferase family 4 protein [Thermoleophilaceae bacterium]
MIRVGLGALFLDPGVTGGSETYLHGLVPSMVRLRPDLRFELATTRRGGEALAREDWAAEVELLSLPCDDDEPFRRTWFERAGLRRLARRRGWSLLHSLSNRGPRRAGIPHVLTVHDVIFFHERTMGALSTHGMRWAVRTAASKADAVIAGSRVAAEDVARTLGLDAGRLHVVPHGAGRPATTPGPPPEEVRRRFGLGPGPVLLCVGAKRPHKNQVLLASALPALPGDVQVVMVGHDEGYGAEIAAAAVAGDVEERVHLLDYVSDEELEGLWGVASCAVLPTRAEGFGLPVLEGLRRGVPVACSDIPVLREIGGDVAHYFDPDDPASAAAAIRAALADPETATRGRAHAARFTWDRAAEATLGVYGRVLA